MEAGIAEPESIGHHQVDIGQHSSLQAMEVTLIRNFLRRVGAYSEHLHPTPIELSAQFFQPT